MARPTDPAQETRQRLLSLLRAGDLDGALQAGLMDHAASGDPEDAPLLAAQRQLRTAWDARERHRARAARLARRAAERAARRASAAAVTEPPVAAAGAPAASAPALPPAAAAALARARAKAAGRISG
ncbi:hypothetical protein [Pseudoxanthomonas suwonensis]|uniref:Uncharacterized protein n=1 Tax=Pseudoxanthomonas suwonensis TaxID=314722 RepID=A0A0E3Z4M8_9GAMM|nr:hypothetical protein [Pseudoxanthomonas suwonensis]AKC87533.1 hypothetical protein WQ53_12995 [Pseudoxanthomonas suwonensis]